MKTIPYGRQNITEKDIKTIGEFVKANEEAKEKLEKLFSELPE